MVSSQWTAVAGCRTWGDCIEEVPAFECLDKCPIDPTCTCDCPLLWIVRALIGVGIGAQLPQRLPRILSAGGKKPGPKLLGNR